MSWYAQLNRPPLSPPDWVFGPVWTVLYLMIITSITIYVIKTIAKPPFLIYLLIALHVISNLIWAPIFFQGQSPGLALIDIVFLDISLFFLIRIFWKTSKVASALLWPYFGWVLFATYLNTGFYWLN